jgi:hypothetical protein
MHTNPQVFEKPSPKYSMFRYHTVPCSAVGDGVAGIAELPLAAHAVASILGEYKQRRAKRKERQYEHEGIKK